jgi:hypothetical protein
VSEVYKINDLPVGWSVVRHDSRHPDGWETSMVSAKRGEKMSWWGRAEDGFSMEDFLRTIDVQEIMES